MKDELVPNCLLTKSPVYFLAPPASFFSFGKDSQLSQYIADHGYEVVFRRLPAWVPALRRDLIRRLLMTGPCHVILSKELGAEFWDLLQENPPLSVIRYTFNDGRTLKENKSFLLNRLRGAAEDEWSEILSEPEQNSP